MGLRDLAGRLDTARKGAAGLNSELRQTPGLAAGAQVTLAPGAPAAGGSPIDSESLERIELGQGQILAALDSPSAAVERRRFSE